MTVPEFRLLVAGQFASMLGDYCYAVALPWLVLDGSGGTTLLGTVLACYGIPRAVTIPLGGVLADRFGGRRVMLAADVVRALCSAALAATAAAGEPSLAALAPIAAVLGASSGVFLPASYTLLPAILPAEQLGRGNAVSAMANQFGVLQTWTPAALLGRVMSMVMLAITGAFPVSVAVAGLAVHRLGPGPFFPVAGATIALAVSAALSQRAFREHRAGQTYGVGEPVGS